MANEGSNDLKDFLLSKKSKLKNVDEIYRKLSAADMDCDELSTLTEIDLRETLNEVGLKKIEIGRLISVLRNMNSTQVHKESDSKKVVVLSGEEGDALNRITKKCSLVEELMKYICTAQKKLEENCHKNDSKINNSFDEMVKCMNIRREALLTEISKISDSKTQKLESQKRDLTNYVTKLNECNISVNKLIHDPSMAQETRKKDILAVTQHILHDYDRNNANINNVRTENGAKLSANPNFKVMINVDTVNEMLDKIGQIRECKDTKELISNSKNKKNAKNANSFNPQNQCFENSVSGYAVKWNFYNKRYARFIGNAGCTFSRFDDKSSNHVSVACSCPCEPGKGVYEWTIGAMGRADHAAIGIASEINHLKNEKLSRWIGDDRQFGNAYYLLGSGRIMSGAKCSHLVSQWYVQSWQKDDMVSVKLDLENYKLMFFINKEQVGTTINVAKGCNYYPIICTQSKNVEFIII